MTSLDTFIHDERGAYGYDQVQSRLMSSFEAAPGGRACDGSPVRCTVVDIAFTVPAGMQPAIPGVLWRGADQQAFEFGLALTADGYLGQSQISTGCSWTIPGYQSAGGCNPDNMPGTPISGPYCFNNGEYCTTDYYVMGDQFAQISIDPTLNLLRFGVLNVSVGGQTFPDCFALGILCANDAQCNGSVCVPHPGAIGFMCGGLPCTGFCADPLAGCCPYPQAAMGAWPIPVNTTFQRPEYNPNDLSTFNGTYEFINPRFSPSPTVELTLEWIADG